MTTHTQRRTNTHTENNSMLLQHNATFMTLFTYCIVFTSFTILVKDKFYGWVIRYQWKKDVVLFALILIAYLKNMWGIKHDVAWGKNEENNDGKVATCLFAKKLRGRAKVYYFTRATYNLSVIYFLPASL